MQRATKLALLVAVASTTLTTTTGFADTATQTTPNITTPTSVADSAISEPSTPATSEAVDDPLFIPLPNVTTDSAAPSASVSSETPSVTDTSDINVVASSETDLAISLPAVLPGDKSLLTSAASSAATTEPNADITKLITDISIVDTTSESAKSSNEVAEAVGSDATTPSEEAGNKVQVSTKQKQPVTATTSTHSQSSVRPASATNVSETNGEVVKTSIHVVPAQQATADANQANVPSVKTPSSTEKNIAPDQGNHTINVVQTVAVKASNLADDVLPKAAYQFAWTPIAFVVVIVTITAWAVAYYTILRRQKMREYQILMHD